METAAARQNPGVMIVSGDSMSRVLFSAARWIITSCLFLILVPPVLAAGAVTASQESGPVMTGLAVTEPADKLSGELFVEPLEKAPLAEDSHYFGSVYRLPAWIDSVSSICPWRSADDEGYVRVIRTRETWGKGLYLQWVSNLAQRGVGRETLSTVRVYEIGPQLPLVFELDGWVLLRDECHLSAVAIEAGSEQRFAFELGVRGLGQYRFQLTRLVAAPADSVLPGAVPVVPVSPGLPDPAGCTDGPCPADVAGSQSQTARGRPAVTGPRYR
jgi:hypothetical protein